MEVKLLFQTQKTNEEIIDTIKRALGEDIEVQEIGSIKDANKTAMDMANEHPERGLNFVPVTIHSTKRVAKKTSYHMEK